MSLVTMTALLAGGFPNSRVKKSIPLYEEGVK